MQPGKSATIWIALALNIILSFRIGPTKTATLVLSAEVEQMEVDTLRHSHIRSGIGFPAELSFPLDCLQRGERTNP